MLMVRNWWNKTLKSGYSLRELLDRRCGECPERIHGLIEFSGGAVSVTLSRASEFVTAAAGSLKMAAGSFTLFATPLAGVRRDGRVGCS